MFSTFDAWWEWYVMNHGQIKNPTSEAHARAAWEQSKLNGEAAAHAMVIKAEKVATKRAYEKALTKLDAEIRKMIENL